MGEGKHPIASDYSQLVTLVRNRVSNQYSSGEALGLEQVLGGVTLNEGELSVMSDFAHQVYTTRELEDKVRKAYMDKIKPFRKKINKAIALGSAVIGAVAYLATKKPLAGIGGALFALVAVQAYKHVLIDYLAQGKCREENISQPSKVDTGTVKKLKGLDQHTHDYIAGDHSYDLNYRHLVFKVAVRVTDQYFEDKPLSIDNALLEFNLNDKEREIMTDFAQRVYNGTKLEVEAEKQFWENARPYNRKVAMTAAAGSVGIGLLAGILSKNAYVGIISGSLSTIIGLELEDKFRYIFSFFAGRKRRKFGDIFNPKEYGEQILTQLGSIGEHSNDYVHNLTLRYLITS